MKAKLIQVTQVLPINIKVAWEFFSNPKNLNKVNPPDFTFHIVTKEVPDEIFDDQIIEYKIVPFLNLPMKWVSQISEVEKYKVFKDTQIGGPFAVWEHTHLFEEIDKNTVKMYDLLIYKAPLGILGTIADEVFITKQLEDTFKYRKQRIEQLFPFGS